MHIVNLPTLKAVGRLAGVAALCCVFLNAHALNPDFAVTQYRIENWNISDGMPHNSVGALFQDRGGYLWIGTYAGAARFDGHRFLAVNDIAQQPVPTDAVDTIEQTSDGVIWFGTTAKGLHGLAPDGRTASYGVDQGLLNPRVTLIYADSKNRTWIGTAGGLMRAEGAWDDLQMIPDLPETVWRMEEMPGGQLLAGTENGVWELTDGQWTRRNEDDQIGGVHVWDLSVDQDTIWVGWRGGLSRWQDNQWHHYVAESGLPNPVIRGLTLDVNGALWFATSGGGVGRLRGEEIQVLDHRDGLSGDVAWEMLTDNEGNIWIGSSSGLTRISDSLVRAFGGPEGLDSGLVWSLLPDDHGGMWAGLNGNGLAHIGANNQATLYGNMEDRFGSGIVLSLAHLNDDLYLGTFAGADIFRDGQFRHLESVPEARIRAMLPNPAGSLWIAPNTGLGILENDVYRPITGVERLDSLSIAQMKPDSQGGLIIAAESGGLWRYRDRLLERIDRGESQLPVRDFWVDPSGRFWIASIGLFWLDADGFRQPVEAINQRMPSQFHALIEDDRGQLWGTSNVGVVRADIQSLMQHALGNLEIPLFREFAETEGMRSSEANGGHQNPYALDDKGQLWIPTTHGVAIFDTRRIDQESVPLTPQVERILADGRPQVGLDELTLDPGVRRVEVEFTALRLTDPGRLRYRYRLKPAEPEWTEIRTHQVPFNGLTPGHYQFEVAVAPAGGQWGKPAMVEFEILPFWWQRRSVHVLGGLLALLLVVSIPLVRIRALRDRQNELQREVRIRTEELAKANSELQRIARTDALTGLPNRREFNRLLEEAWASKDSLCLAVIDIDHFKAYNDALGHLAGDECLTRIGAVFSGQARNGKVAFGRIGGEEFCALFRKLDLTQAEQRLHQLQDDLKRAGLPHPKSVSPFVTLSIGLTERCPEDHSDKILIGRADTALYEAKNTGRNRLVIRLA